MYVRTRQVYLDFNGNPIVGAVVYIGLPDTDPRQEANRLALTNGINGEPLSNPYYTDANGRARGINNEKADPYINETEYSIEFRSANGALVDRIPRFVSDAVGSGGSGGGGDVVDSTIDNLGAAMVTDLTDSDTIYIQSYAGGWQGTSAGAVGDFTAYRTGSVGTPSTGNAGTFYDLAGNEWKPLKSQRLYAEMFGAVTGAGNDSFQAIQDMVDTADAQGKPCYLDGDEYFINTQSNTAVSYSVLTTYGILLPTNVAIHGSGTTALFNTSPDSGQFMFFGENVDSLIMDGLILDANSVTSDSGALYLAGCAQANLDLIINNSATTYISASTTRQSGTISFEFQFENTNGFALSGKSGGYEFASGNIHFINCQKGFEVSRDDSDGFSLPFVEPQTNIGTISGDVSQEVYNVHNGSFSFGSINVDGNTAIIVTLDDSDISLIKGDSISGCNEVLEVIATGLGKLIYSHVGSVYAPNINTFGVSIDSNIQLIEKVVFDYVELDGTGTGLVCGDDTQLGTIEINGGNFGTLANGIVINQTNGQKLIFNGVTVANTGTIINDSDKSLIAATCTVYNGRAEWDGDNDNPTFTLIGLLPLDWDVTGERGVGNYGRSSFITHNLGHTDYSVSACGYDPDSNENVGGFCHAWAGSAGNKQNDTVKLAFASDRGASSGNTANSFVDYDFTITSAWN